MTDRCGALRHIAQLNLRGMVKTMNVGPGWEAPGVCVPGGDGTMWFDELLRLPDHIAGALSACNMDSGEPAPTSRLELVPGMLREVFADAENVAVIRLRTGRDGFGRSPFLLRPQVPA